MLYKYCTHIQNIKENFFFYMEICISLETRNLNAWQ